MNNKSNDQNDHTVFIIDDDPRLCDALRHLFASIHLKVETFFDAQSFLAKYKNNDNKKGCVIIDVRMPGMSGLELLEHLMAEKERLPVIILTGYGDMAMAIRAMKAGAHDFILKPFNDQYLIETIQQCIDISVSKHKSEHILDRFKLLTERERQVIHLISEGKLNKEIAYELCVSMSTIEAHRANIMRKMEAKNIAQLIKLYIKAQTEMELQ